MWAQQWQDMDDIMSWNMRDILYRRHIDDPSDKTGDNIAVQLYI